jgi:uncharacterized coiled-coil protein SlyX
MDTAEIIAQMRANPALAEELRAVLLSRELLGLPAQMERVEAQIASLTERMERVEAQIASLTERMERVEAQIAALTERMERVEAQIAELVGKVGQIDGRLAGLETEARYRNHVAGYFGQFLRGPWEVTGRDLARMLADGERSGAFTRGEASAVGMADLVVAGEDDEGEAYLVVEVSRTIHLDDIRRAAERAALLRRTGRRVQGVVAGDDIEEGGREAAQRAEVHVLLDGRLAS